jgi:hypothetical protein
MKLLLKLANYDKGGRCSPNLPERLLNSYKLISE